MNTEIVIQNNNVKRTYLRITRIGHFYTFAIVLLLLASAVIWLFAIKFSTDFSGFCYPTQNSVRFFFPVDIENTLQIGDTIWVGNVKGEISYFEDSYLSYDMLDDSSDSVYNSFLNSKFFDMNETYRSGIALFKDEIVGSNEYRVMWEEITLGKTLCRKVMNLFGNKG